MGYLRLVPRHGLTRDKEVEQAGLIALLATIPGVSKVALHGQHPKGGYRVDCKIDAERFESVIATLELEGWMSSI